MAERKWTEAQCSAIEDEGGALLVSAAAGSGKTAVLVERAVRMICREDAPVEADRLLILTFTRAAAEELRGRIAGRLEQEIRLRPGEVALKKQRMLLRRAFVGTMDAFCQQLVREHFAQLDLPPDIGVGEPALFARLSVETLAEVMEEMYADEDFAAFAALYGQARTDLPAQRAVLALWDYTQTLPHPAKQLRRFAEMYEDTAPLGETAFGRELLAEASGALDAARGLCANALALAETDPALEGYIPALESDEAAVAQMRAAVEKADWDAAALAAREYRFPPLKAARDCDETLKAAAQAARAEVKKIVEELKKNVFVCGEAEYRQDRETARPMVRALVRAAQLYAERFFEAKLAEKALDFADYEHLALRLLQDEGGRRTPLAEQVSARYDAVMVDEYQDTNELQDALYTCLARADGGNLFYVGDVKQSIYRFRKANPGLFLQKKEAFAPHATGRHPAVITLGQNFRSGNAVIDGVNFLFSRLMCRQVGEVAYTPEEYLVAGRQDAREGAVELDVVQGGVQEEAAFVAGRIREMVAQGAEVEGENGPRPCQYGDFAILLLTRGRMPLFAAALKAEGIPVAADTEGELLQSPEVLPLAAALRAIDNPGDDVSLAAAMLGPLFRFDAGEVARLRANAPKGRLWGALAASTDEKVRAFVKEILYYRALAGQVPVGRLCEALVDDTGYLSAVAAMAEGPARKENLQRFLGWAAAAGAPGRGGLAGFIRLLDSGAGPESSTGKSAPGHVSLLTIHKSKGLEFPICFVCELSHQFNMQDLNNRMQLHAHLGVGLSLRSGSTLYKTLPFAAIRARARREALSEQMRVLYVALTRAKERLVMTFAHKDPAARMALPGDLEAKLTPYGRGRAASMADWVLPAALCHPAAKPLVQAVLNGEEPPEAPEGLFAVQLVHPQVREGDAQQEEYRLTAAADEELAARLLQEFARETPRGALQAVPVKMSVSALTKSAEADPVFRRPSFMYSEGLSAAEKGTAQHAFMQYADFDAAARDVDAEIRRLAEEQYLDEATARAVDKNGVRAFLSSPLAARIARAARVLREYDFITAVPAGQVQPGLGETLQNESVLVQGIADLVLVCEGEVEIVDYKTDRGATAEQLAQRYSGQLALYGRAIQKRLGLPVTRLTIWSFSLAKEIEVPALNA